MWPVTLLMRLQQALLHPHPMESNPAWAQTGATMVSRINLHRVRAQYQPAVRLERPLVLVFRVSREVPNGGRFQGQTCSVSCEDFKIYIHLVSGSGPINRDSRSELHAGLFKPRVRDFSHIFSEIGAFIIHDENYFFFKKKKIKIRTSAFT
jgi:hypothetical protein